METVERDCNKKGASAPTALIALYVVIFMLTAALVVALAWIKWYEPPQPKVEQVERVVKKEVTGKSKKATAAPASKESARVVKQATLDVQQPKPEAAHATPVSLLNPVIDPTEENERLPRARSVPSQEASEVNQERNTTLIIVEAAPERRNRFNIDNYFGAGFCGGGNYYSYGCPGYNGGFINNGSGISCNGGWDCAGSQFVQRPPVFVQPPTVFVQPQVAPTHHNHHDHHRNHDRHRNHEGAPTPAQAGPANPSGSGG